MILNLEQNKYVYLSLGSNLGDRLNNINRAIDLLSSNGLEILKISPIYLELLPSSFKLEININT